MAYRTVEDESLASVADAIRKKTGGSETLSFPDGFSTAIAGIETGIDTSDATAAAEDIADGKTAYVNGEKIEGSALVAESGNSRGWTSRTPVTRTSDGQIGFSQKVSESNHSGILWRNGSYVYVYAEPSSFGDAAVEDVVAGKTCTSAAGLKVTGTLEVQTCYTGTDAPSDDLGIDGDLYLQL